MPVSCKCILDRMVFKGAMTEEERDKLLRNLKGTVWHKYPDEKPPESTEYNVTLKNTKCTSSAYYFTEDDTWYGGNDLYVPNACIKAWAELPEPYEEGDTMTIEGAIADLQNLIDSEGIPFWAKPSLQKVKETVEMERRAHGNKNDVIIVQLDTVMPVQRAAAFRKDLLDQMKEGVVIIPPWAHVEYVGDECEIEIKEMEEHNEKTD